MSECYGKNDNERSYLSDSKRSYILFSYLCIILDFAAIAGLSLTYAMETLDAAQFGVQLTSEIENLMTSVERVVTYSQLTPEDGYTARDDIPTSSWPSKGDLLLQNLSLTYVDGGRRVLKDITFEIKQKEKIGVVGRTGSGKSSIVSAIFRMPEPDGEVRTTFCPCRQGNGQ